MTSLDVPDFLKCLEERVGGARAVRAALRSAVRLLYAPGQPGTARAGQRAAECRLGDGGRDDGAVTGEEQLAAESRRGELSARLAAVRERIAAACGRRGAIGRGDAGRGHQDLPGVGRARLLHELGVRDVRENRDQEAAPEGSECADLAPELTWHFIGQLQTNKAASVVRYAASSTRWTGCGWSRALASRPQGRAGWSPAWSR